MDWNWFFSSVAQSAAAIVAVFSAFIISKIINNQSQFESNKRRIKSILIESKKLKELASYRRIGWYCQYLIDKETKKIQDKKRRGELPTTAAEYYFTSNLPPFVRRDGLIERIDQIMKLPLRENNKLISDAFIVTKSINELSEESQIREEQNEIYSLIANIKHHTMLLTDFIEELSVNQENSPVLKWSIIASMSLFYIGVIYPLGFMPLRQDTVISLGVSNILDYMFCFKGFLLLILGLIFTGINIFFLTINSRLVYDKVGIEELKSFTNFGDYSVYFKNMDENQKARLEFEQKQADNEAK